MSKERWISIKERLPEDKHWVLVVGSPPYDEPRLMFYNEYWWEKGKATFMNSQEQLKNNDIMPVEAITHWSDE